MPRISSRPIRVMLIVVVILILPVAISAQSFWLQRSHGKTLALEIFKPTLHSGVYNGVSYPVDYSFKTAAFFFSLRWPIGKKTFLVAELPFAYAAFDTKIDRPFSFFRNSGYESTIGNPYVGFELGGKASPFFAEAGIRFPIVATEHGYAMKVGAESDIDREEAFLDFATVKVMINYRLRRETGLVFRLRLGAAYLHNFDTQNYGCAIPLVTRIGYKTGRLSTGAYLVWFIEGRNEKRSEVQTAFNRGSYFSFKITQEEGLWANISLGKLQPGVIINPSFADGIFDSFAINLGVQLQ